LNFALQLRVSALASAAFLLAGLQDLRAQNFLDAPNPAQAIKKGDLPEAARQARLLADDGDPDGQLMLSLFYWHGIVLPQSFQDALNWVTLSAVSGNRRAHNARQAMLKTIEPAIAKKSMEWARSILNERAEAGDNSALFRLAVSYTQTFGFGNALEAYFWFNLAVSSGDVSARKQRNELIATLKQSDLIKTQERAKNWFDRWRKVTTLESTMIDSSEQQIENNDSRSEGSMSGSGNEGERNASPK
jgi:TPR repeat protein